ncbi:hypothetical protein Lser_V15G32272 [Lactuca serriola]
MSAKRLPFFKGHAAPFLFITLMNIAAFPAVIHAQNCTTCVEDRVALLAIKSKIKEDPKDLMISWNDSLHCQWEGVTCNPTHQRVMALNLSNGGLLGSLSPSIANLTFLREIQLQNNFLSGEIPPEVGRLLLLQELSLYNNSFEGNIPASLSNCSSLQVLDLSQNILVGNIPASLSNCSNLRSLVLGQNNLVGKIPDELGSLLMLNQLILPVNNFSGGIPRFIGNLTSLEILSLGRCGLGGSIPDVFHRLSNLTFIVLVENKLVGSIPPSLYNLSSLEILLLDDNRLTGRLPTNLGSMQPHLQALSIPDNHFSGPLPTSVLSSSNLRILDLSRNNFSGKLVITSREACNLEVLYLGSNHFGSGEDDEMTFIEALSICKNLRMLDIGYNQMKGFLPYSLGNLSNTLSFLSFASNAFSGGLPSSVGNLSGLTSLDLSNNKLTGTINQVNFSNLGSLQKLDLKNNSFSGSIPGSLGNLSLLIELDLGLNEFNGSMPSSLGNCKRLIKLVIDRNNLTGEIPRKLFELSTLSISLNLGGNRLSGELPQEVGNLKNLNEIILANNRLSGDLPTTISSCSSLVNLDISSNFFQGTLPSSLRSLRALQTFDASHNNFTGKIPTYLEEIPLENLNISFNGFEGEVLSKGVFANASTVSLVGNSRLCGGVPELRLPKCHSTNPKRKNWRRFAVILAIIFVAVLIGIAVVVFFVFYRRKSEIKDDVSHEPMSRESLIQVSYEMLYKATDGFSTKNFIGEGSFSSVYRGNLDADSGIVAIKVLNLHRRGGSKSFIAECEALKNARHRNLAKVITCCSGIDFQGNEFKAIVYEFLPNGTLDQWLHDVQNKLPRLSLLQRVCVALDVAYALEYLHRHAGKTIVHCDLKPSNILLDEDMVAHVGDFGLSKILQPEYKIRQQSSSTGVRGTVGYAAPEYGLGSHVSPSGDMYSYGILLLEMITSKKPTDAMFGDGLTLHHYAKKSMGVGALEIVDPLLLNDEDENLALRKNERGIVEKTCYMKRQNCLHLLLEIGVSCSLESPQYRMDAKCVVEALRIVKDDILGTCTLVSSSI